MTEAALDQRKMFCPECRGEYVEGIRQCDACGVDLVESLTEPAHDNRPLVTVFKTPDPALVPVIHSLLQDAGIPYTIRNEEILGLFPATAVGLAIDPRSKGAEVQVPADRADEAKRLLEDLTSDAVAVDDGSEDDSDR